MAKALNQTQGQFIIVPTDAYDLVRQILGNSRDLTDFFEAIAEEATPRVDGKYRYFGTDRDAALYFDGTNLYIDTGLVNPSDLIIDCGANKTIKLAEPVYDDLPPVPITAAKLGSSAPTLATFVGNIQQYTFDATNDFVIGSTELTHKYKEGTDLDIHIHWATNGTDGTDRGVKWQLEYSISNAVKSDDAPFDQLFGGAVVVSGDTIIPAGTGDRAHIITDIGSITGTSLRIGAYITWRFNRTASAVASPAADPFALAVGFHSQIDTMGSRQEYVK